MPLHPMDASLHEEAQPAMAAVQAVATVSAPDPVAMEIIPAPVNSLTAQGVERLGLHAHAGDEFQPGAHDDERNDVVVDAGAAGAGVAAAEVPLRHHEGGAHWRRRVNDANPHGFSFCTLERLEHLDPRERERAVQRLLRQREAEAPRRRRYPATRDQRL